MSWRILTLHKIKLAVSVAGIAFAVVLMFVQLAFLKSLFLAETQGPAQFNTDLIMISPTRVLPGMSPSFPLNVLRNSLADPDVENVTPVYTITLARWRNAWTGKGHLIQIYGIDPDADVFNIERLSDYRDQLRIQGAVLFDRRSRDFYGPTFQGVETELSDRKVTVIGQVSLGPTFRSDGNALMSRRTYFDHVGTGDLGPIRTERVDFGLIRTREGADLDALARRLEQAANQQVRVQTKTAYLAQTEEFVSKNTPIAFLFGFGVVLGISIGIVFCYNILYNDIAAQLRQYATLKAIGYQDIQLTKYVVEQALLLSLLGYVLGYVVASAIYAVLSNSARVPMPMTAGRAAMVFALTVVMCQAAGLLAVRRVHRVDPAECF
ncbi:FtsX-like permease family protein [Planctomycetes bacterium Pan216]|uniref:FtsX-like permease family protein n=1 Tax=Kolteria novifilia TaxID=2527975 RepID=A0A518B046_9BACT|nr:FtsX-like permease family protein [Planctomycetes bacterium Pan216]